jgi:hypothetical protein
MATLSRPVRTVIDSTSRNWAGYAAFRFGTTFTAVRAHWVQPAVVCGEQPARSSASFVIGIDGDKSSTIEEIGTDARCKDGAAIYSAWWEAYPSVSYTPLAMRVHPGDLMSASINSDNRLFTFRIKNASTGARVKVQAKVTGAKHSSAEWIVLDPSCGSDCFRPLANFDSVTFSGGYTTGDGHTGTIGDPAWHQDRITMINPTSISGDPTAPGPLNTPTGGTFTVKWGGY